MIRRTIDASVAIKWFVPEVHSEAAIRWLDRDLELVVPDLIFPELGNILWKKRRREELTAAQVRAVLAGVAAMPLRVWATRELLEAAVDLAVALERTVYDCTYLAVAIAAEAPLLTADKKLFNALRAGAFAAHVQWVGEEP